MLTPTAKDIAAIAPVLILAVFGMLVLMLEVLTPRLSKRILANIAVVGLAAAAGVGLAQWPKGPTEPSMQGLVAADGFSSFFTLIFAVGGILSVWLSVHYLERRNENRGEYYALILFTTLGAVVMADSLNLICIFIGLEILSIALYILAGYQTDRLESDEAALKYFLLGSFASAFFLYGIALIYGASGTLQIPDIADGLRTLSSTDPGKNFLLLAGIAMLLVGFGFKVAVVPFHIWTPDVYQGAPTSVTAFMSVVAKAAGFAAFLRVLVSGFSDQGLQLQISAVLASIAALTMLVGNVVAVVQPNIKRMLAYSSIAHAGYIMVGMVAAIRPSSAFGMTADPRQDAVSAVLFYTLVYTVSNLGAFGVVLALRKRGEEVTEISDLAGLASRYPGLAALMSLFMLSLAGLPPTAGFFGKLFLIQALVGMNSPLVWLIVLFALTSVVSFYYYLGVIKAMYMDKADDDHRERPEVDADWHLKLALGLSAIGVIVLGFWSSGGMTLARRVAEAMFVTGPFSAMR